MHEVLVCTDNYTLYDDLSVNYGKRADFARRQEFKKLESYMKVRRVRYPDTLIRFPLPTGPHTMHHSNCLHGSRQLSPAPFPRLVVVPRQAAGAFSRTKPAMIPAATSGHPRFRNAQEVGFARQELKNLILEYKGFGILTLIRLLLFRSFRSTLLGLTGIMLLIGQWVGPVGYAAAKIVSAEFMWCQG